jgi:hypothetical protein
MCLLLLLILCFKNIIHIHCSLYIEQTGGAVLEMLTKISEKQTQLSENQTRLSTEQALISRRLPALVVGINITPSMASTDKNCGYSNLLDGLGIDPPVVNDVPFEQFGSFPDLHFSWSWRGNRESDSYAPLCAYIKALGLEAIAVADGQYLGIGENLLFNVNLFSIRTSIDKDRREPIVLKGHIRGRTDIVILRAHHNGGDILRHMVKFVLEVKEAAVMRNNFAGCIREACTQLLGLCGDNSNNSPSVILTDLTVNFLVVFLEKQDEPQLKFAIRIQRCSNLRSALFLAGLTSETCISCNFGRPATPEHSED